MAEAVPPLLALQRVSIAFGGLRAVQDVSLVLPAGTLGALIRIAAVPAAPAAKAVLSVMPLDSFVDKPACRMEVVDDPNKVLPVAAEVQAEIDAAEGRSMPMGTIERFAFYEAAKNAYAVIQTGERRFYGCFLFKMGVIAPDEA